MPGKNMKPEKEKLTLKWKDQNKVQDAGEYRPLGKKRDERESAGPGSKRT
jgi:hypothetical protein